MSEYKFSKIEPKWQKKWSEVGLYEVDVENAQNPYYNLWMFPYPSGARMHVGHAYASTGADIHGRFMRMQGKEVFQPMGFDAFGIHGENYAIKVGRHPRELVDELCQVYRDKQFRRMGHGYDWSHEVRTYQPDYYKWTQWIFLQLYKNGLAERRKASVNWCPSCKTVLADEQVIQGECERCDSRVERKELKQWFFKITDYAQHLLDNLKKIDWPERIKTMQRNWIGRSEGAKIFFSVPETNSRIEVFTTRPDTVFGATFFVLAPESEWVGRLVCDDREDEVMEYVREAESLTMQQRVQREEKTGVFTGGYVINPANEKKIPVYVADYVLEEYGSGAVMGVPAHDQRDLEFAKKFDLPIIEVVRPKNSRQKTLPESAYLGTGQMVNSGEFDGIKSERARKEIVSWLSQQGLGESKVEYRLRDWCVSRQRYWGAPIPMIYCQNCGEVPVPEEDLPVLLPETEDWRPTGTEKSPLAAIDEFVETTCPRCGGKARRETDVCDNFLDSAWYYYAYPIYEPNEAGAGGAPVGTEVKDYPFQEEMVKRWLPVDMYVGGEEHSVLHLMYTRFLTMVFNDLGLVHFDEPFKTFFAHGLITKDGTKMSKSKGNVVHPEEYIDRVGADAFRTYLLFLGPYDSGGDFSDSGLRGVVRFLDRVWRLVEEGVILGDLTEERGRVMHQTIKRVTEDIQEFSFNTAIAALMEWVNEIRNSARSLADKQKSSVQGRGVVVFDEEVRVLLRLLAPFAPHVAEELWQKMQGRVYDDYRVGDSVHLQSWPEYNPKLAREEMVVIVVQVDGKLRGRMQVQRGLEEETIKEKALRLKRVERQLQGEEIKKVVYVPEKLVNFVTIPPS